MSRSGEVGVFRRLAATVSGWFGRSAAEVTLDDLNPGTGRGLGIEPLEERIAPGTLIVNPPGSGGGTTVDLPDEADQRVDIAIQRSPALERPTTAPNPPPI